MANVYATKNGVWSDVTVWNTGTLPTSSDDVYANNFTVTIDVSPTVLSVRNEAAAPIVAGGGFILNDSVTLTCTGLGVRNANTTCITYSGSGSANIVANVTNNGGSHCLVVDSACTLGIVGNITTTAGNGVYPLALTNNSTVYITGDVQHGQSVGGGSCISIGIGCSCHVAGSINLTASGPFGGQIIANNGSLFITGNVYYPAGITVHSGMIAIRNTSYLHIIGSIVANASNQAVVISSSSTAINIFSGPFICGEYGTMPYLCARMHLIPSIGTYFEFRDETTNGALSPGAIAPATRLITLGAAVDAPDEIDVRDGVLYASASLEGSAVIPHEDNVAYNVPVDHTVGTQLFSPEDVWKALISNLNTPGSIGERLKNCATVDTVGAQLDAVW